MKNKMKRIAAVVMVMLVLISAVACGETKSKGAFEMSKEAYNEVSAAYNVADNMSDDIYEAWRLGIQEGEDLTVRTLAEELHINESDLVEGICKYMLDDEYEIATEEVLQKERSDARRTFSTAVSLDSGWQYVICFVENAYEVNGMLDSAKSSISSAKTIMKDMSAKYSDYEHYPALKGYFTSVNSLLSWCESPDGAFEQAKTTVNDYRNEIRDYQQDLDYIFED